MVIANRAGFPPAAGGLSTATNWRIHTGVFAEMTQPINLSFSGGRQGGLGGFCRGFLAFEVARAALAFQQFVVLSAHKTLLCPRLAVLWGGV
ncbi:MAG: hypothetical protein KGJ60_15550 [Verrucomicrobiota bacterium]|nr:hypothetical protein [Verrucomicrobiota bacterium]